MSIINDALKKTQISFKKKEKPAEKKQEAPAEQSTSNVYEKLYQKRQGPQGEPGQTKGPEKESKKAITWMKLK